MSSTFLQENYFNPDPPGRFFYLRFFLTIPALLFTVQITFSQEIIVTPGSPVLDSSIASHSIGNDPWIYPKLSLPLENEFRNPGDSVLSPSVIKKRTRIVAIANIVGYSTAMIGLYSAWYSKYEKTGFHSFDDSREWLQMDKAGHVFSAYAESRISMELWRWTGIERKKRIWLGGMSGAAYQTVIEVLDGFSEGWGWSWADFSANVLGSGALVAQELAWDDQRIKLKFSFHSKKYDDPELNQRSKVLFGESSAESFLKDYNGQTYWASANLKPFFPNSSIPDWLSVSVGYGAEGLFGGRENVGRDEDGTIIFNRPDIKRYRKWFLAPDIDLSKIKTNSKALRFIFTTLSVFKFPLPSLEWSNGKLRLHALYF
ncbi:MAG TPA: DUF2279 domain-containing protein [Chitinophagaceae bacterium]|nr:DUF2279 domain-containing protein [Chitinophagaceae bacterium]